MTDKIYPEVSIKNARHFNPRSKIKTFDYLLQTNLRLKHNDQWVLVPFQTSFNDVLLTDADTFKMLQIIMIEIYKWQLMGIVDMSLYDLDGNPAYLIDSNQEDEKNRIMKI
jgi:hypothetical protein